MDFKAKKSIIIVMKKYGLIVTNAYEVFPSVSHMVARLKEEFLSLGVSIDVKTSLDVLAITGGSNTKLPYDFCIFLDKDIYVASKLEKMGVRLFNSSKAIELTDDKMKTHLALEESGIKMPKTLSAPLRYSSKENPEFLKKVMNELSFPLVAKENFGSMGKGVYLVNNEKELKEIEGKLAYIPRIYQEFIESSKGKDIRLIVIGHKVFAVMERVSQTGDFRSNIACGGVGKEITALPLSFVETAENAATILGLDYCGVDLLIGPKGEPILCEVNSNAFIKGIEETTGKNVAKEYAKFITSRN